MGDTLILLFLAFIFFVIFGAQLILARNISHAKTLAPELCRELVGLHGISSADNLACIRIDNVAISLFENTHFPTAYCSVIEQDHGACRYKLTPGRWHLVRVCTITGGISTSRFKSELDAFCKTHSVSFFDPGSIDSQVCSILFLNLPEFKWAVAAIEDLESAIAPIEKAYDLSLTNKLLAGSRESLKKTISTLESEIRSLRVYAKDAEDAMRQSYQYLSFPGLLKHFDISGIDPLRVYLKSAEMKAAFDAAFESTCEYDRLETRAGT